MTETLTQQPKSKYRKYPVGFYWLFRTPFITFTELTYQQAEIDEIIKSEFPHLETSHLTNQPRPSFSVANEVLLYSYATPTYRKASTRIDDIEGVTDVQQEYVTKLYKMPCCVINYIDGATSLILGYSHDDMVGMLLDFDREPMRAKKSKDQQ
jgi:hypothetical protein